MLNDSHKTKIKPKRGLKINFQKDCYLFRDVQNKLRYLLIKSKSQNGRKGTAHDTRCINSLDMEDCIPNDKMSWPIFVTSQHAGEERLRIAGKCSHWGNFFVFTFLSKISSIRDLPGDAMIITFFMQDNYSAKLQDIVMLFLSKSTSCDRILKRIRVPFTLELIT